MDFFIFKRIVLILFISLQYIKLKKTKLFVTYLFFLTYNYLEHIIHETRFTGEH